MDARIQKHRMARWLALLFVLFASAPPARAALESVAAVPDGGHWLFWDPDSVSPPASSPDVACNSGYNSRWTPAGYVYVGSVPNQYGYANLGYRDCLFRNLTGQVVGSGSIQRVPYPPACPTPTINPAAPYTYSANSGMCERNVLNCPIDPLPDLPADDLCAQLLENIHSTQAQKDAACGTLTPAMQTAQACFESRLSNVISPATGAAIPLRVTADIRSVAYQTHFREIWDKMEALVRLTRNNLALQTACAARRAEIAAEKGCDNAGPCTSCYAASTTQRSHCLNGRPALPNPNDAQHTRGNAIDVSRAHTIDPLQTALGARRPPETIQQFLNARSATYPNGCNLNWGGAFTNNYDPVHFYVR